MTLDSRNYSYSNRIIERPNIIGRKDQGHMARAGANHDVQAGQIVFSPALDAYLFGYNNEVIKSHDGECCIVVNDDGCLEDTESGVVVCPSEFSINADGCLEHSSGVVICEDEDELQVTADGCLEHVATGITVCPSDFEINADGCLESASTGVIICPDDLEINTDGCIESASTGVVVCPSDFEINADGCLESASTGVVICPSDLEINADGCLESASAGVVICEDDDEFVEQANGCLLHVESGIELCPSEITFDTNNCIVHTASGTVICPSSDEFDDDGSGCLTHIASGIVLCPNPIDEDANGCLTHASTGKKLGTHEYVSTTTNNEILPTGCEDLPIWHSNVRPTASGRGVWSQSLMRQYGGAYQGGMLYYERDPATYNTTVGDRNVYDLLPRNRPVYDSQSDQTTVVHPYVMNPEEIFEFSRVIYPYMGATLVAGSHVEYGPGTVAFNNRWGGVAISVPARTAARPHVYVEFSTTGLNSDPQGDFYLAFAHTGLGPHGIGPNYFRSSCFVSFRFRGSVAGGSISEVIRPDKRYVNKYSNVPIAPFTINDGQRYAVCAWLDTAGLIMINLGTPASGPPWLVINPNLVRLRRAAHHFYPQPVDATATVQVYAERNTTITNSRLNIHNIRVQPEWSTRI